MPESGCVWAVLPAKTLFQFIPQNQFPDDISQFCLDLKNNHTIKFHKFFYFGQDGINFWNPKFFVGLGFLII